MSSAKHRRRRSKMWPVIALVLLLTAFGSITMGLREHQVPLPGPVALQDTPPVGGVGAPSSGVSSPGTGSAETPRPVSPRQPADLLPAPSPAQSSADLGVPGPELSGSPGGTASTSVPVAPPPPPAVTNPAPGVPAAAPSNATGPQVPRPVPAPAVTNPAPTPAAAPSNATGPAVPRSVPVALRVPAIGVDVSLSTLGLNPDRTVQVPTDFQQPGWFGLGPSPGQTGSSVILGHVDSYKGPAVFFRIRDLQVGDQVAVDLADGATAHFRVTAVAMYAKDQFPAQQVYAPHGGSALQLVTCGGTFDTHTRSYLSNIVAYTTLVATTPATR